MKLSIIIPVYRVENTLDRCLKSIMLQGYGDYELILVDDGSPDRCPQLCDEWAVRDRRITVIHKANGGLSDARNAGIEQAQGEYITFVDSDDFIGPDTYQPLMQQLERRPEIDMLEFPVYWHYGSKEQQVVDYGEQDYTDMTDYWLKGQAYLHTYACNKIYRSVLFEQVRYPKGKVFEDAYTLPELLRKARKVKTSSKGFYHYCWNEQGITATATGQQLRQLLEAHMTNGMPMDDTYYLHLLNIQIDVCEQTGDVQRLMPRKVDTTIFTGANKLKAIINNTLGIRQLCKIIHFVHHVKKPNRW
jgi:glycosyltransferase involved in cell wall biosynthesis